MTFLIPASHRACFQLVPLLLAAATFACTGPSSGVDESVVSLQSPLTGYTFGVTNESPYENNWVDNLSCSDENSQEFGNRLAEENTWSWWYDLHGAKPWFEDANDQYFGGNDSVSFLYSYTHGSIDGSGASSFARFSMYETNTRAISTSMRLGDENVGLGVWASWACHVLQLADGYLRDRWISAFAGGLYMILGSPDIVWDGWTTSDTGEQLAENMNDGDQLGHAWTDAMGDWWESNDVAVANTGRYPEDCVWRYNNAHWPGIMSFGRVRDSDIHYTCWVYWYDL